MSEEVGERLAPGPGGAKEARVDTNLMREPCKEQRMSPTVKGCSLQLSEIKTVKQRPSIYFGHRTLRLPDMPKSERMLHPTTPHSGTISRSEHALETIVLLYGQDRLQKLILIARRTE